MKFVIMTGMSGAGKSTVMKYLEDFGFFCVDNLPPSLIPKFAEFCMIKDNKLDKIALVVDIRGGTLLNDLAPSLMVLRDMGINYEMLFLEASDEAIIKRFKESRRNHPLVEKGRVIKGIKEERKILENIKRQANYIIDTSDISTRSLKGQISNLFLKGKLPTGIVINIISFGFKYGLPSDSDLVFDVRFIPNPFYIHSMKKLSGNNEPVKKFVMGKPETVEFLDKTCGLLDFLIPNYITEGKSQLYIGIGCTGGRHRSVVIANELQKYFEKQNHKVVIEHRDIDKENGA